MRLFRITLEILSDFDAIRPAGTYPTHIFDWDDPRSFEQMKQELREFMTGPIPIRPVAPVTEDDNP
jgi:hypothetical protein